MSTISALDFVTAWKDAHEATVAQSADEKARFLLDTVGPRIASAALGMADARQLKHWARDAASEPREHAVQLRLDALFWITRSVATVYSPAVAARFLRSANPQLGDEAPLVALRSVANETDVNRVLTATRAFLEG